MRSKSFFSIAFLLLALLITPTSSQVASASNRIASTTSVGQAIVTAASAWINRVPYCFDGGNQSGPTHGAAASTQNAEGATNCLNGATVGFDCSGLTLYAVSQATGIVLPHSTTTQPAVAQQNGAQLITSSSLLQAGDLVFFGGTIGNSKHVGIYVGSGNVLDANVAYSFPGVSRPDGVRIEPLTWQYPFVGAVRFGGSVPVPPSPPAIVISNANGQMAVQLANFPTGTGHFFCHSGLSSSFPTGGSVGPNTTFVISAPNQSWTSGFCSGNGNFWLGVQAPNGASIYSNQVFLQVANAPSSSHQLINSGSGRCVDVPNRTKNPGVQLQIYTCNGTPAQTWIFNGDGSLQVPYTNGCIDIRQGIQRSGQAVQLYTCNGTIAQKWKLNSNGTITSSSGYCLDVQWGHTTNGTPLQIYNCNGTSAQQWRW